PVDSDGPGGNSTSGPVDSDGPGGNSTSGPVDSDGSNNCPTGQTRNAGGQCIEGSNQPSGTQNIYSDDRKHGLISASGFAGSYSKISIDTK
ncbi:MAG: hypothetical protein ACRD8K_01060, partial [Nitrososphaeraceae archaeon]